MKNALRVTFFSLLALVGSLNTTTAMAQNEQVIEEVITTGTRLTNRTATESMAPVDVISGRDFTNQGDSDLSNLLRNVVPSYNVNTQPISDAATIVRPANLRGLAPDHTLVLVNGKRRHRAAVIYWLGNGVADGAQGPDISAIPAIALKQVEVLRDGASAQYGSDAIAGVMNFKLKDDAEGGSLELRYGEFFEGDGQKFSVAGNVGLPFTADGFVNVSFEAGSTDPTDRSVQRPDAAALIASGNTAVANPAQIWGQPSIDKEVKLFVNMGLELDDNKEFYAFGNYVEKEVEGGFYFRNPNSRGGVFSKTSAGVTTRLVGDLNPDNNINCPASLAIDNAAGLAAVMNNSTPMGADCFVFNELFPGGFTPRFGGQLNDLAAVVGMRGETDGGLRWDVSGSLGRNEVDFIIKNTVNASLGPNTPTVFKPGTYTQLEKNFNIDIAYPVAVAAFASDLSIAAGFEYREEQFEITVGDPESFQQGPLASQGFSVGSNGFPGFSPLSGGEFDRANFAAYFDMEADVTENWTMGAAIRWEDFEDFGTTTNYKLSTNVRISDIWSLRSTASTGFRAPTPGQSNTFNVSTQIQNGRLVNNGTVPPTNPVAAFFGGKQLDAEESTNLTLGTVLELDNFSLTIDYFTIKLEDRVTVSRDIELNAARRAELIASGINSGGDLRNFRFFTNDFDTTTEGFDVVATWNINWANAFTDFSLAYNHTETEVDKFTPGLLDATRIRELEEALPETRWNLTANHNYQNWRFLARLNFNDKFYDSEDGATYGSEVTVDAELAYTFNDRYSVTLGAQNLLDEYPDDTSQAGASLGRQYPQFSPLGFDGGYYYLRLTYEL